MKMLLLYIILIDIAYLNRLRLEKSQENYIWLKLVQQRNLLFG